MAEDNTLLREGLSRLIEANSDLELADVGSNLPELLALIATNVHDALDEMLARFGEEPHVTIATESLVQQL